MKSLFYIAFSAASAIAFIGTIHGVSTANSATFETLNANDDANGDFIIYKADKNFKGDSL